MNRTRIRDGRRGLETALNRIADRSPWRNVLLFCIFETAFYIAYRYGMMFSQAAASPFWFPDSVLLCALLLSRPQRWWIFLLAPLPIRLFSDVADDIPMWFLLATSTIDALKGLIAAIFLRRFLKHPARLETTQEFAVFCALAVLLIPAVSAFGGAAARALLGHSYWSAWEQWLLGDATAQMAITPALLFWLTRAQQSVRAARRQSWIEATLLGIGLLITCYLAATAGDSSIAFTESRFYAPIPFLFWSAIRFGMMGASGAVAILALFAVGAAIDGRGPFQGHSPDEVALALQNFLLLRAGPVYFVAVSIDQRRRMERLVAEDQRRLAHAQRLAVMGELTATIVHEVRQPLSAILSNADAADILLRSPQPPLDEIREIVADIRKSDLHANEAIDRIREFLRNREPRMEPLDIDAVVADALRLVASDARRRRVELRRKSTDGLPSIHGDRTHLQQVLLNLLVNALDAIETSASANRVVTVTTALRDREIEVRVSDRGCGVPPDRLPRLFDSFYTTRKDGMGLGLAIARSIVIAHRGRIWGENNADGGATFHLVLPIAQSADRLP